MNADRLLVLLLVATLLMMAVLVLSPEDRGAAAGSDSAFPGRPRNVDVDALRRRQLSGELSEHEALYYREGR